MEPNLVKTINSSEIRGHLHSVSSPSERLLSMPPSRKASLSTPGTPVLEDFPQNDDEKERIQRRRSRVFDLQFSTDATHLLLSPSNRSVDVSTTISKFTNTQITEHYSTCIKLSTENKITTKNAFGLHLIDFMSEILKQKDTEPTNFKVASGTLDASTKIYAVRVDAIHADVYRVLGDLGKDTPSQEEESHDTEGSTAEIGTTKKASKPKKKQSCKTIEQNVSNISVSEVDRKCEVDPMFQKTAASFDECSTAGVFLSTLHCQDYRSELLFPSDMQILSTGEPLELPDLGWVDMTDLKARKYTCQQILDIILILRILRLLRVIISIQREDVQDQKLTDNTDTRSSLPGKDGDSRREALKGLYCRIASKKYSTVDALLQQMFESEIAPDDEGPSLDEILNLSPGDIYPKNPNFENGACF